MELDGLIQIKEEPDDTEGTPGFSGHMEDIKVKTEPVEENCEMEAFGDAFVQTKEEPHFGNNSGAGSSPIKDEAEWTKDCDCDIPDVKIEDPLSSGKEGTFYPNGPSVRVVKKRTTSLLKRSIAKKTLLPPLHSRNPKSATYACYLCDFRCKNKGDTLWHMAKHNKNTPYACNMCSYRCSKLDGLNNHLQKHYAPAHHFKTLSRIGRNNIMMFRFYGDGMVDQGISEEEEISVESMAGGAFPTIKVEPYLVEQESECVEDPLSIPTERTRKQHMGTHSPEKLHACEVCGYSCKSAHHLRSHVLIHTEEKPFICNTCGYRFKTKGNLNRHMATHTENKRYTCDFCDHSCRRSSHMKEHLLIHTGERPFACNLCGFTCRQSTVLKEHTMKHGEERPFSCNLCVYRSKTKNDLRKHKTMHTSNKPYACGVCDHSFRRTAHLKRHMLTHSKAYVATRQLPTCVDADVQTVSP